MITATSLDGKLRTYEGTTSTELNFALGYGGTITLDPKVTYKISDSLKFPSNTILDGNGATIKLAKGLPIWGGRNASISQKKAMLMIRNNSGNNITVRNLTVDGSQSDYYPNVRLGTSCFTSSTLIGCNGLTIENVKFKNSCNDAILLNKCNNVMINKISVDKPGHDGVSTYYVDNITVQNSKFRNRTNSSVRFYNVTGGKCLNNDMGTTGGGYCGVELQGSLKNCTIEKNYIHGLPYPGIVGLSAKYNNVLIQANKIVKCKYPGITGVNGATLNNNTITY